MMTFLFHRRSRTFETDILRDDAILFHQFLPNFRIFLWADEPFGKELAEHRQLEAVVKDGFFFQPDLPGRTSASSGYPLQSHASLATIYPKYFSHSMP